MSASASGVFEAKFVIVGGGIAGVSCIETLSFYCQTESILLLTESPIIKAATNLVALGKSLTRFDIEQKHASTLPANVQVVTDRLLEVDSHQKIIRTAQQNHLIKYEFLCICTGARPKIVDQINATNQKYILGIRDTESVCDFEKRIQNSRKIVIVGNGGIASELVYELKNVAIEWVVKDKYVSQTFVDPGAATFFQTRIKNKSAESSGSSSQANRPRLIKRMRYTEDAEETVKKSGAALGPDWHTLFNLTGKNEDLPKAVHIHYQTGIKNIDINPICDDQFPVRVTLQNDEVLECDFVVSATGVVPNLNFKMRAEQFRFGPDGGIFVNELMETSISNVYAAGDVCFAGWEWAPHWFQMRLWTQARQMGAMAGKSMAAKYNDQHIYPDFCFELFGHVTQLFGYQVVLLGKYNGQGLDNKYEALLRVTQDKEYIKYVLVDGKLQGAILIGETGLEETTENLILNQLDLTPYGDDILDPDIDIEDYFD
ncbi:pyridine nucleotide-disulfide oxidoreductase domain-containing protein 1 [Sitodiplosis mosellana]|uniref:pyridine nucleotide-disulfide oxidoreductase domain-containing protein 1 n=1 Tax=Sitodiplosis mosellana TaxID=263140 RepID=UPI0024440BC4|nr:pyridine nucleotide-disulfide oxidoreductase domain-containing protein 1 [Sitodiplosis mosellana]